MEGKKVKEKREEVRERNERNLGSETIVEEEKCRIKMTFWNVVGLRNKDDKFWRETLKTGILWC